MKRICVILLCIFMLILGACGNGGNDNQGNKNVINETTAISQITVEEDKENSKKEGIHCILEEDTLIFSGNGCLTGTLVQELIFGLSEVKIKNIRIEDGIVEIGTNTFSGFSEIQKIEIAGSVEKIGANAFEGCINLKEVKLAEGIINVAACAFYGCEKLESILFPQSLKIIGTYAFEDTAWLAMQRKNSALVMINGILVDATGEIDETFATENITYMTREVLNNCNWLEEQGKQDDFIIINGVLVDGRNAKGDIIIPESVKYIADEAFALNDKIVSVILPEGIKYIGSFAFAYCNRLESINIPENIKDVDMGAFYECVSLAEIEIPNSIVGLSESVFEGCIALKKVLLSSNLEYIGENAFKNCENVETVLLPDKILVVEQSAFENCARLKKIILPERLLCLGQYAFSNCISLEDINIPKMLKYINSGLLRNCRALTSINLPEKISVIDDEAFKGCINLEKINLPENLEFIGDKVFYQCEKIDDITISKSVTEIGYAAFEGCKNLISVSMPDTIEKIDDRTFYNCISLKGIILPKNLLSIGFEVFRNCSGLNSIIIPEGITKMKSYVFSDCGDLISVAIPNSVKEISESTFDQSHLVTIYCESGSYAEQFAKENNIAYVTVNKNFWEDGVPMPTRLPSLQEKIENGFGTIELAGNMYDIVYGEKGALIWRYVEATFDESPYYRCCFITDNKEVASEKGLVAFEQYYRTEWTRWSGYYENFVPIHIGEDMFYITVNAGYEYAYYHLNPFTRNSFTFDNILDDKEDFFWRHTDFNDGYAVCSYLDVYYTEWAGYQLKKEQRWLALLDRRGNFIKTDIELSAFYPTYDDCPGIYSDGVFYHENAFYDLDSNKVLDLAGRNYGTPYTKRGIYAPFFDNGVCRLVTEKNGKYWIFDIDKSGNMLTEAKEFDILLLND